MYICIYDVLERGGGVGTAADIIKLWTKFKISFRSRFLSPRAVTFRTEIIGRYVVLRTLSTVRCVGPTELSRSTRHGLEPRLPGVVPIFVISISALDSSFFKSWCDWMQPCAEHDPGISCTVDESQNYDLQRQGMDKRPFITSLWRVSFVSKNQIPLMWTYKRWQLAQDLWCSVASYLNWIMTVNYNYYHQMH